MKITMSKTREQFPLSVKKVIKKTISWSLLWCIFFLIIYGLAGFSLISFIPGSFFGLVTIGVLILLSLMVLITYLYQQWYYAVYFYDLTDDYIVIRKGPITPREITIPYERVQDIYVDQDLLDRIFGLYDVHLSSATISSGMQAHIDGLEQQAASGLRTLLLQTVSSRISKNRPSISSLNQNPVV